MPASAPDSCDAWEKRRGRQGVWRQGRLFATALVLGTTGGFITRMLTPFEFGLGGPSDRASKWMSWIERASRAPDRPVSPGRPVRTDHRDRTDPATNLNSPKSSAGGCSAAGVPDSRSLLRRVGGDIANGFCSRPRVLRTRRFEPTDLVPARPPAQRISMRFCRGTRCVQRSVSGAR